MVNLSLPQCISTADAQIGFKKFVNECLSNKDKGRTSTVIPEKDLKDLFIDQRAEASSLLQNLQSISDLKGQANLTSPDLTKQKNDLDKTIQELTDKIQDVENQIEVSNQVFIQKATDTPKNSEFFGNLQDISLGVFFLSLIVLAVILSIIQFIKSNSLYEGLAAAFYTLVIFFVIIIVVYALLTEIA